MSKSKAGFGIFRKSSLELNQSRTALACLLLLRGAATESGESGHHARARAVQYANSE